MNNLNKVAIALIFLLFVLTALVLLDKKIKYDNWKQCVEASDYSDAELCSCDLQFGEHTLK